MSEPITPARLAEIEALLDRDIQRGLVAGQAADATPLQLCAALRQAWRETEQATADAAIWQQAHADAWKLIGRCDMAFELIAAGSLTDARLMVRRMRTEIAALVAKGRPESEADNGEA